MEYPTNIVAKLEFKGESALLDGAIDVYNLNFGVQSPGSAAVMGGAGVGVSRWSNVSFSANVDTATNQMISASATTKHLSSVVFEFFKGTGSGKPEKYYSIELKDAVIVGVTISGSANELLSANYNIDYSEIKGEYFPQTNKGSMSGVRPFQFKVKDQTGAAA
jgi:type VI secretion system Hcp family effector